MEKQIVNGHEILISSENIFTDLGLPDAEKLKLKSELVVKIIQAIRRHGLTQEQAARKMGLTQPRVSEMMRGNLAMFSERKLMDCLNRLGYDIEIRVKPAKTPVGHFQLAFE
ncbi:helix-turn-helix domain-containing protein [Desulfonatronum parangueonense]